MRTASIQHLLLATRNAHKAREVREILGDGWIVEDLSALPGLEDVEETGETFEENARIKALAASPFYDGWVLADDSGLEVDALGGAPGVRSARYAGDGAGMEQNRALLMSKMHGVEDRAARFRCVLALAKGDAVARIFSGAVEGMIAEEERGGGGFGYDPMFVPEGCDRTFAEMSAAEKHSLSHRARALAALAEHFRGTDMPSRLTKQAGAGKVAALKYQSHGHFHVQSNHHPAAGSCRSGEVASVRSHA